MNIYTASGKQWYPRTGQQVPQGSLIQDSRGTFYTLQEDRVYVKKVEWNDQCQCKEVCEELRVMSKVQ